MEKFSITKTEHGLYIEGFPDAVKFVRINGRKGARIAHLALHRSDLVFARECCALVNTAGLQPYFLRQALWRSAVTHFIKCFGQSKSRSMLQASKIYKNDLDALEIFEYFKNLRNKHFIHDENPFTQCEPGAVLNNRNKEWKIEKIITLSLTADTLYQENWNNLHILITRALEWVVTKYDHQCTLLTNELEGRPYDDLLAMPSVTVSKPGLPEDVGKTRS